MKRQLLYEESLVQDFWQCEAYYEAVVRFLRKNLLVYPYHYAKVLMMREQGALSPFDYYLEMIGDVTTPFLPFGTRLCPFRIGAACVPTLRCA